MSDARMSGASIANVELKPAILRDMQRRRAAATLVVMLGATAASLRGAKTPAQTPAPGAPATPADVIVHHAVIYTVNPQQPKAAALAIRGDKIVTVGADADALKLRGPKTIVLDAGGRAIVPGLQDSHGHFAGLGAFLQQLDLRDTTSYDAIVARVRGRAATAKPGEWILGRAWDQNRWADTSWPTHEALDKAAPNNPVYLTRVDGHASLVNQRAFELAGVTADTKDPDGGRLIRDKQGKPSGVLVDNAMRLVRSKIPKSTPGQVDAQILLADAECRRLGLTTVHDAGEDSETIDAFKRLIDAGKLRTRLYVMISGAVPSLLDKGPVLDYKDHHLAVRAVKLYADGALGSRGAALLAPYSDEPGTSGLLVTPPEELYKATLAASKAGFQTAIHAIGDRANRIVLDTFERVQREMPNARALRMRDEHTQILNAADIPRFKALEVIASMQPTHCTSDMPWAPIRLGPQRIAEGAYVWRKLINAGARIASGSDFPVEEANPMLGFYAAITRQDVTGKPPEGWAADQRLTREETLASFTANGAYASHAEAFSGTLEPGKLADLVILSADVMTIAPRQIPTTTVWKTIIGGQIVYDAGGK
jgi:predicted amidohydrolase YtcJ